MAQAAAMPPVAAAKAPRQRAGHHKAEHRAQSLTSKAGKPTYPYTLPDGTQVISPDMSISPPGTPLFSVPAAGKSTGQKAGKAGKSTKAALSKAAKTDGTTPADTTIQVADGISITPPTGMGFDAAGNCVPLA
ncbi:MAG: hypothetical protein ACP5QA_12060 [Phycisphaerae bacterium]